MDQLLEFSANTEASLILAAIVESSDDAIIGKDLQGIILTWNRGAEQLYGYTAGDVRRRSISLLIPEHLSGELSEIGRRGRLACVRRVRLRVPVAAGRAPLAPALQKRRARR